MTSTPALTTVADAENLLRELAETHEWVSVFWDKRDRPTPEISIIVDGDGQNPKAFLARDVYANLVKSGVVGEDTYAGFHARRLHDFKTPPVPEKTGPSVAEVAEQVIRRLVGEHPELPLKAAFFRGINKGNVWNPINEEIIATDLGASGAHVFLKPGAREVVLTAWDGAGLFSDCIGNAVVVPFPKQGHDVDVEALAGTEFRETLLAAVRERAAVIAAARTH